MLAAFSAANSLGVFRIVVSRPIATHCLRPTSRSHTASSVPWAAAREPYNSGGVWTLYPNASIERRRVLPARFSSR